MPDRSSLISALAAHRQASAPRQPPLHPPLRRHLSTAPIQRALWRQGIEWALEDLANHPGTRGVMSMSLTAPYFATLDIAVSVAHDAGVPVVAAAGNDGIDKCATSSPSTEPKTIIVGATTNADKRVLNFG